MPNILNIAIDAEYEALLSECPSALFVQPVGMSVAEVNEFRGRLADGQLRMQVLKGTLAKRVLEARGLSNTGPIFVGPAAIITSITGQDADETAIAAAKVVAAWRKDSGTKFPEVKGGLLEGSMLDRETAQGLEKMPGRRELQARIAGQIVAPARRLAGTLTATGGALAGALSARIAQLEKDAG
ncbi:MAG: 50S ribosomal protein L10 [Planctomycetota bacterium]|jgi:large subunit ribosomal protein L10